MGARANIFARVHRGIMSVTTERPDGSRLKVAEVEIADETARVRLKLVNEECEFAALNCTLVLREAVVSSSEDYVRVELDRFSSIERSAIALTKEPEDRLLLL